jgi:drug/metabolite transporter (DMT)-like permease
MPLIILAPFTIQYLKRKNASLKQPVLAGFFSGAGFAFYTIGLIETSVVHATLLFYLTLIWSTILGFLVLSEPVNKARGLAIISGLFGYFLLLNLDQYQSMPLNSGDLCAALSGMFWAVGATLMRRWPETSELLITWFQMLTTTVFAAVLALLVLNFNLPPPQAVMASLPLALVSSVIVLLPSTLILFRISQILYPGRVGVLMMSEVATAIVSALLLLPDKYMTPIQWFGAGAIILAACFEVLGPNKSLS